MSFKLLNRVRMTLTVGGAGPLTTFGAALGFQSFFAAGASPGDTTPYVIEDGNPLGSSWEIGVGTINGDGTFMRNVVTQSSLGGATPLTVSTSAVLSSTFRAQDLIGTSSPTVVQYSTVQSSGLGAQTITLGQPPQAGNFLFAMGQGGGQTIGGVYSAGFNFQQGIERTVLGVSQYDVGYGVRAVQSGDAAGPWTMGTTFSGGPSLTGVLVEVAGVDITRCSDFLMGKGQLTTTLASIGCLSSLGAMTLMFAGGDNVAATIVSPTMAVNNSNGVSRLVFGYDLSGRTFNGIQGSTASGILGARVMSLAGL